jgi:redox-sensing transcriptional repressor
VRDRSIPEATVARLPIYLRCLIDMAERGTHTVSSEQLADAAGVNSAKVRKDLSYLGSYGTRGVGYDVEYLIYQVRRELGLEQDWPVAIIGVGNLGHALANYKGFAERGFRIVALLDGDGGKVGEQVGDLTVEHIDDLDRVVKEEQVAIGVVARVNSILNFAPAHLQVPDGVFLRKVDLSTELQILSFHEQRRAAVNLVRQTAASSDRGGPGQRPRSPEGPRTRG